MNNISKLLLLLILNLNVINAQINKIIDEIAEHPNLISGRWSAYAKNAQTGEVIVDYNSEKIMYPASNLKLLTSAVALDKLGSDFKMSTFVEYDGTINLSGELIGNLFIRGEGDPTLGSTEMEVVLPYDTLFQVWVDKLKENGITKISGDIIANDSYLDYVPLPDGWAWDDMGNYYAAGTSGLCINENLYYLYFKPSNTVGGEATVLRTEPEIPGLKFVNHMKTGKKGSGDNGYIYAAPWQYIHQLEGTVPTGVKEFSIKGALPDPAKFVSQYFRKLCEKNGITVSGEAKTIREHSNSQKNRKEIFIHQSPPLKDIVFRLNKKSVNLYAEQLLKMLGKHFNKKGTYESGLKVTKNWLKTNEISTENLFLHDGSGLTRANGLTTKFLVDLLMVMKDKSTFMDFYNSLPIAGDSEDIGGIKKLCVDSKAAKNLCAKTGGHNRIRAHSGYVHSQSGELVCFSMIANDYKDSSKKIDKLHEKIMIELANLK
jgi:D-alanyl-D-alanine carboxypeptidase/D-alanyl-D-alanine-endopeptidase (penicillin-binding protein 4)